MSTKNESKLNNHIRLFKKVLAIPKKKMSLAEKVMFCYIISYVITGQVFDLDNKHLANKLGDTIQSITDYITRLETMGLVKIDYDRVPPSEGGYYITQRFITVINLPLLFKAFPIALKAPFNAFENSSILALKLASMPYAENFVPKVPLLSMLPFPPSASKPISLGPFSLEYPEKVSLTLILHGNCNTPFYSPAV